MAEGPGSAARILVVDDDPVFRVYFMELLAGMGHRGEWIIRASELGIDRPGSAPAATATDRPSSASNGLAPPPTAAAGQSGSAAASGIVNSAQIREIVENVLEEKLKPMMAILVETRQSGPKVTDILGGIGYIFGLIGVAAYFRSKHRKP